MVLRDIAQAVKIEPGAKGVIGARFLGRVADAQWACDADIHDGESYLDVAMTVVIDAECGPAAPDAIATAFDYYVAVADRQQTILNKQVFWPDCAMQSSRV